MCFESVRLILALSALEDYYCVSIDVHNAYLYGKLDKEIYIRQPEGYRARGQENKVIHLQYALYGLKQARLA
jgi:Reverse transcriptase (RNA-dependent DNA polymerase)